MKNYNHNYVAIECSQESIDAFNVIGHHPLIMVGMSPLTCATSDSVRYYVPYAKNIYIDIKPITM